MDFMKEALEIVKEQAGERTMTAEEIVAMVRDVSAGLAKLADPEAAEGEDAPAFEGDPRKAIKEKSVTCLVCGKVFKILTKKHLASHGLDRDSYCAQFGLKKGTALVSKSLQRTRRKKMTEMKLWEKRRAAAAQK